MGEFFFYLAPSKIDGVGVFAARNIKSGQTVKLFWETSVPRKRIPKLFQKFIVDTEIGCWAPRCFGRMSVGWYLNHSKNSNLDYDTHSDSFTTTRDIKKGEEVTVDYIKAGFGKP